MITTSGRMDIGSVRTAPKGPKLSRTQGALQWFWRDKSFALFGDKTKVVSQSCQALFGASSVSVPPLAITDKFKDL